MVLRFIKKLIGEDERFIKKDDKLFNNGDYKEALMKYENALKLTPNDEI